MFNRARDHGKMLRRAYLAARDRIHEARTREDEMRRELAMRPLQTIIRVENLDKIIVDVAEQDRDEALRRRDVAMGALSDVRVLHHKDRDNKIRCVCGALYDKCDVARLVDRWEGVLHWERSQAGQAYRGQFHRLFPDHPALTDRDYLNDVYGT
jgi:hypothetical protein